MKKNLKFFLLLCLALVLTTVTALGVRADLTAPYDPTADGIVSSYYPVDRDKGFLKGIVPGTDAGKIQNVCLPADVTLDAAPATGVLLRSATAPDPLTLIVTGDLNGDGNSTISDILMIKAYILGNPLTDAALCAGDVTYDGKVTVTDYLRVRAMLLGLDQLSPANAPQGQMLLMTPGSTDRWAPADPGFASLSASDPNVVTVGTDGTLTAGASQGSAYVYALDESGNVLDRCMVCILDEALTVTLPQDKLTVPMGAPATLTPRFNHPVQPPITWTSSDSSVVTVENGTLTPKSHGFAQVTATLSNGSSAQIAITVAPPVTGITIDRQVYKVKPGHRRPMTAAIAPADTGEELVWTSADTSIATVAPDGTLTGVKYGTTTVTATGKYSGKTATCKVKVCDVKQVALTYDDGPSIYTEKLLDFLAGTDAKVTFFLVGNRINNFRDTVAREAAEGHEIGFHSYAHQYQPGLSSEKITSDFEKSNQTLIEITGQGYTLWRAPGGSYNQRVLDAVPVPHILWSRDSLDYQKLSTQALYLYLRNIPDGSIVLMHDLYNPTVKGSILAIEEMLEGDYEFLTVTELLSRDGTPPEPSTNYNHG